VCAAARVIDVCSTALSDLYVLCCFVFSVLFVLSLLAVRFALLLDPTNLWSLREKWWLKVRARAGMPTFFLCMPRSRVRARSHVLVFAHAVLVYACVVCVCVCGHALALVPAPCLSRALSYSTGLCPLSVSLL
jgi:hypothetical protein